MGAPRMPGEQATDSGTHGLPDTQEQDAGKVEADVQNATAEQ